MSKKRKVKENKYWEWILLGLLIVGAFLIRVLGQLDKVFVNGVVLFREVDCWYHMRLADNMVANFPIPLGLDRFAVYPNGADGGWHPLMSWIIGGLGQFLDHEMVGAYLPPVVGALTLIPIFLIGKTLWNKWAGLIACLLVSVIPGEFLHRSLLGFTDHHVLEVFLAAWVLYFLILASKNGKMKWYILAGSCLGLYFLNWWGGLFLLFIISVWVLIQFLLDLVKNRKESRGLYKGIPITFMISGIFILPYLFWTNNYMLYLLSILGATLLPLGYKYLLGITRHTAITITAVVGSISRIWLVIEFLRAENIITIWSGIVPVFFANYLLYIFGGFGTSVEEGVPTTLTVAFYIYGLTFFLFFGGLYLAIKNKINLLFIVFSAILLLATIGQRRWGYYFTIPVALLSVYFMFEACKFFKKNLQPSIIGIIIIFTVLTSVKGTMGVVQLQNNIPNDWYNTLAWMRSNTPDPFEDSNAYYELHPSEAQYGVLSWWDYGHWITRIARRVPMTSPAFQIVGDAGWFLISPPDEAEKHIEKYNIKYIIIDKSMVGDKFYALVQRYWPAVSRDEIDSRRLYSMVTMLWQDKVPGYKLVHQEGDVKIIERLVSR